LVKNILFFALLSIIGFGTILTSDLFAVGVSSRSFARSNMAGGRLGVWSGTGPTTTADEDDEALEFSRSSLYAEFFYSYRISPPLMLDFSFGIFGRGDFKYSSETEILTGTVNLYPIFLSLKLYPLGSTASALQPYFQGGGGLVYGNQAAIDYYYDVAFTQESATKLTYMMGGGVDWPIADQIGLTSSFKYIPVKFGKKLAGIKDYSGWQVSVGLGYIFGSKRHR
jgi:hypothetical protein